jgi:2-polyprenyl-6-methoxyphenol hydroxylase-like FAD-dependent oxidoreductase
MNPSVLIVGAGPVGLTLACDLTRYRVPVLRRGHSARRGPVIDFGRAEPD